MEQLIFGEFEYEMPQLLFSAEKITAVISVDETIQGEIYIGTEQNIEIRGVVTSSNRRIVPGEDTFAGVDACVHYGIDGRGLNPGDVISGELSFLTNIGEGRIPVEVKINKEEVQSFAGAVKNLSEFGRVAEEDFREAFRLFISDSFPSVLEGEKSRIRALYTGLSRQPVTYQNLEEFLIASGEKEPVHITMKYDRAEHRGIRENTQESFELQRSGWGHLRLDIEAVGDFIELPRQVLTDEDFIGSKFDVPYILLKDKLGKGSRYGRIIVRSPYEEKSFRVVASRGQGLVFQSGASEKRHRASLVRDYVNYRTGSMDFQVWAASTHYALNELSEMGYETKEDHMLHAYLLHMEQRDAEAIEILRLYENRVFTRDDLEFAGVYLYLCTLTGLFSDTETALSRIEYFYETQDDSLMLLYIILRMDPQYLKNTADAVRMLEDLYERGNRSPILYLEGWRYLKDNIDLVHRMSPFWCQVYLFTGRRHLLTEEMASRLAYLAGYEKYFSVCLYRTLTMCYDTFQTRELLEAICKYIIQGNPRNREYFKWYSLAVSQGVRITRLYEYYIETMEDSYQSPLPKQLMVYFSYNTNSLSDTHKALLYANIISHKNAEPMVYNSYRERMRKFAEDKLAEGRIGENYAVLYQEFFKDPDNSTLAAQLAQVMFTYRIYCDDKKIRQVIIRHSQLKKEEIYPLRQGVAYPRIFTDDAVIIFQDDKQRRYVDTVGYRLTPLMNEREMIVNVLEYSVQETGVLLYYCEHSHICAENMEVYQNLVNAREIAAPYRDNLRRIILSYYSQHMKDEELESGFRQLDFQKFARVNKKALLELLVHRGMYLEAFEIIEEVGCEGMSDVSLLKLVSRLITREEDVDDKELLALAWQVYQKGKYDEIILRHLMDFRYGSIEELLKVWDSATGFDMDTYDYEEKILKLLIFTSDDRKDGEKILRSYMKQSGSEDVAAAYLTLVAYGYFVKEHSISSFMKMCLEYAYENDWPTNEICHYALLKAITKDRDNTGKYMTMKKELLEECHEQELMFSFFRRLPAELLGPYQLDDKTIVEYHASPEAKVTLFYSLDTGLGSEGEFRSEPLKNMYEGIFVRAFTLFYGETLHYYFQIEEDGITKKTSEKIVTMKSADSVSRSKYQIINRILAARKLDKEKEVASNLKQYLRQEQYVRSMFRLNIEE